MQLEEVILHNFKGFTDYTLKLKQFNVLIGENSSGKTSLLQAIQLVYDSIQFLFGAGEHPRFTGINWKINLEQPISRFGLSNTDLIFFKKIPEGLQISAKWDNGLQLNCSSINKTMFKFELLENGTPISDRLDDLRIQQLITSVYSIKAVMLSPVGTISPHEDFITRPQMNQLHTQGRYNETWRANLFWTYNSGDRTTFNNVSDFIKEHIPSSDILPPRLDEDNPAKFIIEYSDDSEIYDISSGGGGLRTLLSLATTLKLAEASCILLDEPDAHLHSGLQREIAEILLEYTESQEIQMVITTHSPDIIDSVPLDSLLFIDRSVKEPNTVDNVGTALVSLGALTNSQAIAAIDAKSIINIEGSGDKIIFSEFAKKIDVEFPGNSNKLVLSGKKNLQELEYIHRGILNFLNLNIKIAAINDLDYDAIAQKMEGFKKEGNNDVLLLTLGKKEIENYLLDVNVITKAVNKKFQERTQNHNEIPIQSAEIENIIMEILETYKNKLSYQIKPMIRKDFQNHWDQTKREEEGDKRFEELWADEKWRLSACPGKSVLRNIRTEIQRKWGVSLTTSFLCQNTETIPEDIINIINKLKNFLETEEQE